MYVLLHGAKKNVGDFLIFERAKALLQKHLQTDEFIVLPRWEAVTEQLDVVNQAQALIWCGGPGYARDFYPNVVPLTPDLQSIKVPIVPMALGWGVGAMADDVKTFQFTPSAKEALHEFHKRIVMSSVRDLLTEKVLHHNGVDNVTMTGCAAWYSLPHIDKPLHTPSRIKKIVISTPAGAENFADTYKILKVVKDELPQAKKVVVFHRGMWPDKYTPLRQALPNLRLAWQAKRLGYDVINAAYSTKYIEFYKECDLHIGYRVHAHIDFLSFRRPSILIQEDARGIGQSLSLHTDDILANQPETVQNVQLKLRHHIQTQFVDFHRTINTMQDTYQKMTNFLASIP